MKIYQYTSHDSTVVNVIDEDGVCRMSGLADALVPEGAQVLPYAPPTKTPAQIWEEIKAIRDYKTQQGGFPAAGKWFHSDNFSRGQHLGMVIAGPNLPSIPWKTMDGTFVLTTPALAQQIFASAFAQDGAMFAHAEQLKAQVEAAEDPSSVDIHAGWPATFQEQQ